MRFRALLTCLLVGAAILVTPVAYSAAAKYPDTSTGIHLGIAFGYRGDQRTPAKVDYIWGASSPKVAAHGEGYIPFNVDWAGHSLSWFRRHHPAWVVYRCDRRTPAFYSQGRNVPLDPNNPSVRRYQLHRILAMLAAGYRGISIDNFTLTNFQRRCGVWHGSRWRSLGYRPDGVGDPVLIDDMVAWLRYLSKGMRARYPDRTLTVSSWVIPDGGIRFARRFLPYVDGVFDEGSFTAFGAQRLSGSLWETEADWADLLRRRGKTFILNELLGRKSDRAVTRGDMQWALANYLLVRGDHTFTYVYANDRRYGRLKDRPEYHVDLGAPLGPRYRIAGLWFRDYARGAAVVNPSATRYAVDVPLGLTTIRRGLVTKLELAPRNGAVLLGQPAAAQGQRLAGAFLVSPAPEPRRR